MIIPRKCIPLLIFLCIVCSSPLLSQSDEVIDTLLSQEKAGFGNTVYLVLSGAGIISSDASLEEAVAALADTGWKLKMREKGEPIRLGEFSLLVLQAFEIEGGLLFHIFKRPRYAIRELVYLGLLPKDPDPYGYISGRDVLDITGKALALTGTPGEAGR